MWPSTAVSSDPRAWGLASGAPRFGGPYPRGEHYTAADGDERHLEPRLAAMRPAELPGGAPTAEGGEGQRLRSPAPTPWRCGAMRSAGCGSGRCRARPSAPARCAGRRMAGCWPPEGLMATCTSWGPTVSSLARRSTRKGLGGLVAGAPEPFRAPPPMVQWRRRHS